MGSTNRSIGADGFGVYCPLGKVRKDEALAVWASRMFVATETLEYRSSAQSLERVPLAIQKLILLRAYQPGGLR